MRFDAAEGYETLIMAEMGTETAVVHSGSGRSQQAQGESSHGGDAVGLSQSRSRQTLPQIPGAQPEAMARAPVVGPVDGVYQDGDLDGRRPAVGQPDTVRPSGPRLRAQVGRSPRGSPSISGTPITQEIREVPPVESGFRSGVPVVYRVEYHSYEDMRPLFRTRFPLPQTGEPSRHPSDVDQSDSSDSDPSEEL